MNTANELPAYLSGLNDAQRDAATYGSQAEQSGGPLLVIAGAVFMFRNRLPGEHHEKSSPMAGFAAGMQLFPEVLATGIAVTLLVGLVAGVVPAIRSARRSIPDGLRQVG